MDCILLRVEYPYRNPIIKIPGTKYVSHTGKHPLAKESSSEIGMSRSVVRGGTAFAGGIIISS